MAANRQIAKQRTISLTHSRRWPTSQLFGLVRRCAPGTAQPVAAAIYFSQNNRIYRRTTLIFEQIAGLVASRQGARCSAGSGCSETG
jgi:hypothetical protein